MNIRHHFVSFFCVALLCLSSCDAYFEPDYTGSIPEKVYYENMNNLRLGLNAVYNVLQSKDYQLSELLFGEAVSDNMWNAQDVTTGAVYDIVNFTFDTDNSYILTRYKINYEAINKANQVIRSVHYVKSKDIASTQKEIREVYGQAKLLRALCYFNLVRTFGGVSIQPEDPQLDSLVIPRSTEQETYAYIEQDLREAVLLLRKQRYTNTEVGQIDMCGGLGLLMKVLMYEASPGIRTDESIKRQKWEEALEIGQFFIEGSRNLTIRDMLKFDGHYTSSWEQVRDHLMLDTLNTLETELLASEIVNQHSLIEYDKVFRLSGEFSQENLIEINHYSYAGTGSSADESWKLYDNLLNGGSPLFATCTKMMANLMSADPRYIFSITQAQNKDPYITREGTLMLTKGVGDGLLYSKYFVFPSEGDNGGRNYRVMRYAEALLIYAEVLNENGQTAQAVEYANKVRRRARNLFHGENAAYITNVTEANFKDLALAPQDNVREAIWKEKRIEMCGEFDRWYEVCRLNQCQENMDTQAKNLPVEASGNTRIRGRYFKKGIHERFPIPQKEIFISNGRIAQNPGY